METISAKTWLRQLFLRAGFFLLGAYLPGVLVWLLIVSPQVSQKQMPPSPILAGLAILQAVALSTGGIIGLFLLARLQRANIASRYPVGIVILAAIGYLLAVSAVP